MFGPHKWLVVVSYVLVVVITVAVCAVLHRTRFSAALIGRGRTGGRPAHAVAPLTPSVAAHV